MEDELCYNNLSSAWGVVKTGGKKVFLNRFDKKSLADELNLFYLKYDCSDLSKEYDILKVNVSDSFPTFDEHSVVNTFKHCKRRTSPGPDNIGSHLLSTCAEQLDPFFLNHIFMLPLCQQRVLKIWRQSIIVPVAKKQASQGS